MSSVTIINSLHDALAYRRAHSDIIDAWEVRRMNATKEAPAYYPDKGTEERRVIDKYERLSAEAARHSGGF